MSKLEALYETRFSESEIKRKNNIWAEICRYLNKRLGTQHRKVVDIAAGYGDFINNFTTTGKKYAIDINPALLQYVKPDVNAIIDRIDQLDSYFAEESISLFFQSNFLEHITKEQISDLLKKEYQFLEWGGVVCILTPNIRYVGGKYWDFYDHITPITEKAIIEEARSIGYELLFCIKRFLPYTSKSSLPQRQWLVWMYLKMMPFSGYLLGEQSLICLVKAK